MRWGDFELVKNGIKIIGLLSLCDRLKKLLREYGWMVMGIYLVLFVLDFFFCFLLVWIVGMERIGRSYFSVVYIVGIIKVDWWFWC